MAATVTTDARFGKNYEAASWQARGGGMAFGIAAVTYSGTGGMTITGMGFSNPFYMYASPASTYIFEWKATTSQLKAYYSPATTTAAGICLTEVASDTDFTALADGGIRFIAVGFGG
jgi:hypothetical protein